jgi:hypothetical protein
VQDIIDQVPTNGLIWNKAVGLQVLNLMVYVVIVPVEG